MIIRFTKGFWQVATCTHCASTVTIKGYSDYSILNAQPKLSLDKQIPCCNKPNYMWYWGK